VVRRLAGALARHTGQEDTSHHITGTSSRYLYNTSMSSSRYLYNKSPPAGIFTTHHCHLLLPKEQKKKEKKPCTGGGLLSMGLPSLVSSSCLSPYVPSSAPCPGYWTLDTGHWTPLPTPGPIPMETTCPSFQGPDSCLQG
jgi:hypothetical protein